MKIPIPIAADFSPGDAGHAGIRVSYRLLIRHTILANGDDTRALR